MNFIYLSLVHNGALGLQKADMRYILNFTSIGAYFMGHGIQPKISIDMFLVICTSHVSTFLNIAFSTTLHCLWDNGLYYLINISLKIDTMSCKNTSLEY